MGHPRAGQCGHSPNRRRAPTDRGSAPQHFLAAAATPRPIQNAPQVPVGIPPTYQGVPHLPYQGPRTYGLGQPHHPYQCSPIVAHGRGCG